MNGSNALGNCLYCQRGIEHVDHMPKDEPQRPIKAFIVTIELNPDLTQEQALNEAKGRLMGVSGVTGVI